MRVSRAEQAQAKAHDTRREWGRSPSNLSFSAKKARQTLCLSCFFADIEWNLNSTATVIRQGQRAQALAVREKARASWEEKKSIGWKYGAKSIVFSNGT